MHRPPISRRRGTSRTGRAPARPAAPAPVRVGPQDPASSHRVHGARASQGGLGPAAGADSGQRRLRVPGLDGIRALAALFVLGFHLLPGTVPAGFAGVDVFFVLSGFLITSMLVDELQLHRRIDLRGFWIRRFRRLLPAVAVTCIGAAALALAVGGDALVALPRQVLGSLTATYNWLEIGAGSSYFEQSSPLLLTNMWSLAVEQQFYLIWPLIVVPLVLLLPRGRALVAAGIGIISIGLHVWLAPQNLSRAYMGTDTHLWGLMIGAIIAFAVPWALRSGERRNPYPRLWGVAGIAAFVLTLALLASLPEEYMYPWGMVAVSATIAVTIRSLIPDVSSSGPARLLAEVLEIAPLRWLGERSYGIYLWHWPLWVLAFYAAPLADIHLTAAIVVVLSIVIAALSYRFVETPIRRLGFRGAARATRDWLRVADLRASLAAGLASLLVVGSAGWALAVSPDRSSAQIAVEAGAAQAIEQPAPAPSDGGGEAPAPSDGGRDEPATSDSGGADTEGTSDGDAGGQADAPSTDGGSDTAEEPTAAKPEIPEPTVDGHEITMIGDSLTVASQGGLNAAYPGIAIDAEVSRSIQVAPDLIAAQLRNGQLRHYVVVALSTNAVIRDSDIDRIVQEIGPDRELILVTGFGPARTTWVPPANQAIHRAALRYDNVTVADWNARISKHAELLAGDSVHPAGPEGVELYVAAITDGLDQAAGRS